MTPEPRFLLDPEVVQNPYPFYDAVRRTSPVWQVGESNIYLVTAFDALAEAARRTADFSSEMRKLIYRDPNGLPVSLPVDLGPPTLAIADPPVHKLHKQLVFPKFVSKRMSLLEQEMTRYTDECLDQCEGLGSFDFMEEVADAVPIHAISMLIGLDHFRKSLLIETIKDTWPLTSGTHTLEQLKAARIRTDEIFVWFGEQLNARDGEASEDMLDAIKGAIKSGDLSLGEALSTLITLLSAGGESTGSLLGNAVGMLAEKPQLVQALRDEPGLLPAFIEEAGRLESPFRYHLRSATCDTELSGVCIPEGSTVLLMWGAANRDPNKFAEPNALNLERRQQHVTFGRGIHLCIGAALARMEARIVLSAMLRRRTFPSLSSAVSVEWQYNLMIRRYRRLPLQFG